MRIKKSFLCLFESIIYKNSEELIQEKSKIFIFAFQNKFILFEEGEDNLIILDDLFNLISTVTLKKPLFNIRIASLKNSEVLEYIDQFNSKLPIPIWGNLYDSGFCNKLHDKYEKDFRYPLTF